MFDDEKILLAVFQSAQYLYEKREGSGSGTGSLTLTNGSGSGKPKNIWIRWIRIRNYGYNTEIFFSITFFCAASVGDRIRIRIRRIRMFLSLPDPLP